jgi:DNA-binding Xre family transcriptional regulator
MITFDKLFITMEKKHKSGYNLLRDNVIGGGTLARMKQGKSVSTDTINSLCNYLHCKPGDIMTYSPDRDNPAIPGNPISGD